MKVSKNFSRFSKKLVAGFLSAMMLLTVTPFSALAAYDLDQNGNESQVDQHGYVWWDQDKLVLGSDFTTTATVSVVNPTTPSYSRTDGCGDGYVSSSWYESTVWTIASGNARIDSSNNTSAVVRPTGTGTITVRASRTIKYIISGCATGHNGTYNGGTDIESYTLTSRKVAHQGDLSWNAGYPTNMVVGETATATASSNLNNQTIYYSSSNEDVATIDADGQITALSSGTAIITATERNSGIYGTDDDVTVSYPLTVTGDVTEVLLTPQTSSIWADERTEFVAELTPEDAHNSDDLTFDIVDTDVADIVATGARTITVEGKNAGKTTVQAIIDNNIFATAEIIVLDPAIAGFVNTDAKTIEVGRSSKIDTTADLNDSTVTYEVLNPEIASVDSDGTVRGLKVGSTRVKVTALNNEDKTSDDVEAYVDITVTASTTDGAVVGDIDNDSLWPDETTTAYGTVITAGSSTDVSFFSKDTDVVTVNAATGAVKAIGSGTTTISVYVGKYSTETAAMAAGAEKASITVKVKKAAADTFVNTADFTLTQAGETKTIELIDVNDCKNVSFSSDKETVATVAENGMVTAVANGTAVIKVVAANNPNDDTDDTVNYVTVTVDIPDTAVTDVELTIAETALWPGDVTNASASVVPTDAADKAVSYFALDEDGNPSDVVAISRATGLIQAKKQGTATIVAIAGTVMTLPTDLTGYVYDSIEVTVKAPSTIALDKDVLSLNLKSAQSAKLTATVNGYDQVVTWSSNAPQIASVSANGDVIAYATGVAIITATVANNPNDKNDDATTTCIVTVTKDDDDYALTWATEPKAQMQVGGTTTGVIKTTGITNLNNNFTFTSSDTSVVTVTGAGPSVAIKAVGAGSAVVYGENSDGYYVSAVITVIAKVPAGISFVDTTTVKLWPGETYTRNAVVLPSDASYTVVYGADDTADSDEVYVNPFTGEVLAIESWDDDVEVIATLFDAEGKVVAETSYWVDVQEAATGIDITATGATILGDVIDTRVGANFNLAGDAIADTADDQTVRFKSSNTSVVMIDANGAAYAVGAGVAEITATILNNPLTAADDVTATIYVTVKDVVASITATASATTLWPGNEAVITATVHPETADQAVTYASSDEDVIVVDDFGVVTAIGDGTATVQVASVDDPTVTRALTFTVRKVVSASDVEVTAKSATADADGYYVMKAKGDTMDFDVTAMAGYTGPIEGVTWYSGNEEIASVDKDGIVTALTRGITTIVAVIENDPTTDVDNLEIYVDLFVGIVNYIPINVSGDDANPEYIVDMQIGDQVAYPVTDDMVAKETNYDGSDWSVAYSSSNTEVATVDEKGTVTAVGRGMAIISGEVNGFVWTYYVDVEYADAEKVNADPTRFEIWPNETQSITATVTPDSASQEVTYSVDAVDPIVAVSSNGTVSAVAGEFGEDLVTVKSQDGLAETEVEVKVLKPATDLVLSTTLTDVGEGANEVYQLNGIGASTVIGTEITDTDADDQKVIWASSNESILKVDADGKVIAVGVGKATITATIFNAQNFEADDVVATMEILVGSEAVALADEEMQVGDSGNQSIDSKMQAEVGGFVPADNTLTYTSSNPAVVSVDALGNYQALSVGTVTITIISTNGSIWHFDITVTEADAKKAIASISKSEIWPDETAKITASVQPSAANQAVVYETSKTGTDAIVTISPDGLVSYAGNGKYGLETITVTPVGNAGQTVAMEPVTLTIKVLEPASNITLSPTDAKLKSKGDSMQLTATITSDKADDRTVIWNSSDASKVSVNENGVVTSHVTKGVATITATIKNNPNYEADDIMASVVVSVNSEVKELDAEEIYVAETKSYVLTPAQISEVDGYYDNTKITYSSSNPSVLTVDEKGNYTGVQVGEAVLTMVSENGGIWTVKVTVKYTEATSIELNETNVSLWPKDSFDIEATVKADTAEQGPIGYQSGDENVAVVSATGKITAVAAGQTTITVTSPDGNAQAVVYVTVKEAATDILLTSSDLDFKATTEPGKLKGEGLIAAISKTMKVDAEIVGKDAADSNIVWSSSDESIATVDQAGKITGVGVGVVEIRATLLNNPTDHADDVYSYVYITVIAPSAWEVVLDPQSTKVYPQDEYQLTASVHSVYPDVTDPTPKVVYEVTTGPDVVSIDTNGKVTALKPGVAEITAYIYKGTAKEVSAIHYVTVEVPVESIDITTKGSTAAITELEMLLGSEQYLDIIFNDGQSDPVDTSITWTSTDESIVSVDEYGKLIANATGTATIYAYSYNNLRAELKVSVIKLAEGVFINATKVSMYPREKAIISYDILPETTTETDVTWTSSNETVATVKDGIIVAVAPGTAKVTLTADTRTGVEAASKTITVTVKEPVTSVTMSQTKLTKGVGVTFGLTAYTNDSAYNKSLVWTSSNPTIASVDQFGIVTTHKTGTVKIYAVAFNSVTATCTLSVKNIVDMKGVTKISGLYVRSNASVASTALGKLSKNTKVTIVAKSGKWLKIQYKGSYGWVSGDHVLITDDGKTVGVLMSNAVMTQVASVYLKSNGTQQHTVVQPKTRVLVLGTSGSYYKISYGTDNTGIGYVLKNAVKLDTGYKAGVPTSTIIEGTGSSYNPVYAAEGTTAAKVRVTKTNMYSGIPTGYASYTIVGTLYKGEKVTIISKLYRDYYQVVAADGTIGWINEANLNLSVTSTTTATSYKGSVSGTSKLNVRKSASTTSTILGSLKSGTSVTIIGTSGNFYKISYKGGSAYVSRTYIKLATSSSTTYVGKVAGTTTLNVRKSASKSGNILGCLTRGTNVVITGSSGEFYKISYSGGSAYVSKKYITVSAKKTTITGWKNVNPYGKILVVSANIQLSPSVNSAIVGNMTEGQTVRIVHQNGDWYRVISDKGTYGYIPVKYITLCTNAPINQVS